jgi:hypothetical protein
MGQSTPITARPEQTAEPDADSLQFAARLLQALADMASRSRRREADLTAAMHKAGLAAELAQVNAALLLLQRQDCIKNLLPLSDGGLLLTVTGNAMDGSVLAPRAPAGGKHPGTTAASR